MEKFTCSDCNREFDTAESLEQHRQAKHTAQPDKPVSRPSRKIPVKLILAVLAVVAVLGLFAYAGRHVNSDVSPPLLPVPQVAPQPPSGFRLPDYAVAIGNSSAPVNFVEFGDYQCPYCRQFFETTQPQLIRDYVESGKASFYFLDFAFISADSGTLAQGAWCANEQGKYYEYHAYVYAKQGEERSGWGTPSKVKSLAAGVAWLNVSDFSQCLDSRKYAVRVQQSTALGQKFGVTGTPFMFVGNDRAGYVSFSGGTSYAQLQAAIRKFSGQ